jgi:hypothetical protein
MENVVEGKMKVPLILCEILVYGLEKDKPKLKKMLDKLQKQIDNSKTNQSRVRILWYADNGEKTIEEKKEWLLNESNCVFYTFAPEDLNIANNYINNLMVGVNMFDRSIGIMRKDGVLRKKKQAKREDEVEFEEVKSYPPLEILD